MIERTGFVTGAELLLATEIAIAGFIFTRILTQPGHIFDWYGRWIIKLRSKIPKLADPIGYCPLCFTGQIAFWTFLYNNWGDYHVLRHVLFTSFAIFMVAVVGKIYGILKKQNARMREAPRKDY
ncbi:MAG: hypothetical protein SFW35_00680 [Chitinophagales bacterium]|nr:hypothetical protein [Chitinophagales bacterium]